MSEEKKEETVLKFEVGELVACIANTSFDIIKMAQDEDYRTNTQGGVVAGRIMRRLQHEILTDPEKGTVSEAETFIFQAIQEDGTPILNPKDGQPLQIELPGHSLFKTPKSAADFIHSQIDVAVREYKTKLNNSIVEADKGLNMIRKVKIPQAPKLELVN